MVLAAAVYTAQRTYATSFIFALWQRLEAGLCEPIASFQSFQLDEAKTHMKESSSQNGHTAALGFGDIARARELAAGLAAVVPHEAAASQQRVPSRQGRPRESNENVCLRIGESETLFGMLMREKRLAA